MNERSEVPADAPRNSRGDLILRVVGTWNGQAFDHVDVFFDDEKGEKLEVSNAMRTTASFALAGANPEIGSIESVERTGERAVGRLYVTDAFFRDLQART